MISWRNQRKNYSELVMFKKKGRGFAMVHYNIKKSLLSYLKTEIFGHKNQSLNIILSSFKVILRRYLEHEVPQCKSFHQNMSGYAADIMGCKLLLNLGFCEIAKLL